MASISEIKLKVAFSLLGDKSVLYLSNGDCPSVDSYIKKNPKKCPKEFTITHISSCTSRNHFPACQLMPSGLSGEAKKIHPDRNYVIWER